MPEFPDNIYTPRETENLPGIIYDATDKKNMYSEDFQNLGAEINAIEETLGTTPQGAFETVKAWLQYLTDNLITAFSFLELTDTPDSYTGESKKLVRVKEDETGLEFVSPPGGISYVFIRSFYLNISDADGYQDFNHGFGVNPKYCRLIIQIADGAGMSAISNGGRDSGNNAYSVTTVQTLLSSSCQLHDGNTGFMSDVVAQNRGQYFDVTWDSSNVRLTNTKYGSPGSVVCKGIIEVGY